MTAPFFSIIIPVYNVAPYLRECLDSVLAQTFADWEAICVDDGSTDGSGGILDEYAARDHRFRIIHQSNAGVSAARNVALDVASGEWVSFVDADDVLTPNYLRVMALSGGNSVDIKLVDYMEINEAGELDDVVSTTHTIWRHGEVVRCGEYFHPLYAACYRRKTFAMLRFKPLCIGEDRVWYTTVLDMAVGVVHVKYIGYGYRLRRGSAVHSPMTPRKFIDDVVHLTNVVRVLNASTNEYERSIRRRIGQYVTEYTAKDFFWMPVRDRELCEKAYFETIYYASLSRKIPLFQRLVMWACSRSKSQLLTYVLCFIPYKLKELGFHR